MTLFTAEGVLRGYMRAASRGLCHPPSMLHDAYLRWLHTQGARTDSGLTPNLDGWLFSEPALHACRAPGRTCLEALRQSTHLGQPAVNDSKGCGGVMRVAPIGMAFHAQSLADPAGRAGYLKRAFDLGCDAAALTHGHPSGFLTAGVMSALIFLLLDGQCLPTAIEEVMPLLEARPDHTETLTAIRLACALHADETAPVQAIRTLGEGWVAEEALAIGLYCALAAETLESAVVMAVNHDGDSDSTGLIAGHLMGAIHGRDAIAPRWLGELELREVIETVAEDLASVGSWLSADWDDDIEDPSRAGNLRRYPG